MKMRALVGVAVSLGLLAGTARVSTQPAPGKAKFGRFGIDLTSRKADVKPGDDFWLYANGAWDARTEIAADRPSAGVALTVVDEAEVNVRGILDEMGKNPAQYDAYEPVPGTHIKGGLTLGENIGDLGGIEAAYAAFERYQAQHGKAPAMDGLTGDQRFFLAYAKALSPAQQIELRQVARLRASHRGHAVSL